MVAEAHELEDEVDNLAQQISILQGEIEIMIKGKVRETVMAAPKKELARLQEAHSAALKARTSSFRFKFKKSTASHRRHTAKLFEEYVQKVIQAADEWHESPARHLRFACTMLETETNNIWNLFQKVTQKERGRECSFFTWFACNQLTHLTGKMTAVELSELYASEKANHQGNTEAHRADLKDRLETLLLSAEDEDEEVEEEEEPVSQNSVIEEVDKLTAYVSTHIHRLICV